MGSLTHSLYMFLLEFQEINNWRLFFGMTTEIFMFNLRYFFSIIRKEIEEKLNVIHLFCIHLAEKLTCTTVKPASASASVFLLSQHTHTI